MHQYEYITWDVDVVKISIVTRFLDNVKVINKNNSEK